MGEEARSSLSMLHFAGASALGASALSTLGMGGIPGMCGLVPGGGGLGGGSMGGVGGPGVQMDGMGCDVASLTATAQEDQLAGGVSATRG